MRIIKPPTDSEYRQARLNEMECYSPSIVPCKDCAWPVVDGYCCNYCGSELPSGGRFEKVWDYALDTMKLVNQRLRGVEIQVDEVEVVRDIHGHGWPVECRWRAGDKAGRIWFDNAGQAKIIVDPAGYRRIPSEDPNIVDKVEIFRRIPSEDPNIVDKLVAHIRKMRRMDWSDL